MSGCAANGCAGIFQPFFTFDDLYKILLCMCRQVEGGRWGTVVSSRRKGNTLTCHCLATVWRFEDRWIVDANSVWVVVTVAFVYVVAWLDHIWWKLYHKKKYVTSTTAMMVRWIQQTRDDMYWHMLTVGNSTLWTLKWTSTNNLFRSITLNWSTRLRMNLIDSKASLRIAHMIRLPGFWAVHCAPFSLIKSVSKG